MAKVSKVQKSDGTVIMDISQDTVNANNLLQGARAHGSDGEEVQGAVIVAPTDVTETSDTAPYICKSSEHDALYDELVGGSVAWNQFVKNGNFETTSGWSTQNNAVINNVSNNIADVSFETASSSQIVTDLGFAPTGTHIYYATVDVKLPNTTSKIGFTAGTNNIQLSTTTTTEWQRLNLVWTNKAGYRYLIIRNTGSTAIENAKIRNVMFIDLTLMFGTTIADYVYTLEQSTAGSGIEWLKSYGFFTEDYYAYNTGELMSVNTSGKKVVGKNLVEETISGSNIDDTGRIVSQTSFSMHIAKVNKGKTYTLTSEMLNKVVGFFYDKPVLGSSSYDSSRLILNTNIITSPIDGYVAFRSAIEYTTPQCELGSTATDYEPYTELTYPLQSTDLRGLFKLNGNKLYTDGDTYSADGQITRKYGIVDLGTLDWLQNQTGQFYAISNPKGIPDINGTNLICSKYPGGNCYSLANDKVICTNETINTAFWIRDTSYTSAATFKTAMSGVYLIYELATPTTETASPYTSPQMVYHNGTEEYVDIRDVPMPVGGNRKYVDIPDWMVNEYFDDLRTSAYELSETKVSKSGDTMTGNLLISKSGNATVAAENTAASTGIQMKAGSTPYIEAYNEDGNDSYNWKLQFSESHATLKRSVNGTTDIEAFQFNEGGVGDYIGNHASETSSTLDINYANTAFSGNISAGNYKVLIARKWQTPTESGFEHDSFAIYNAAIQAGGAFMMYSETNPGGLAIYATIPLTSYHVPSGITCISGSAMISVSGTLRVITVNWPQTTNDPLIEVKNISLS